MPSPEKNEQAVFVPAPQEGLPNNTNTTPADLRSIIGSRGTARVLGMQMGILGPHCSINQGPVLVIQPPPLPPPPRKRPLEEILRDAEQKKQQNKEKKAKLLAEYKAKGLTQQGLPRKSDLTPQVTALYEKLKGVQTKASEAAKAREDAQTLVGSPNKTRASPRGRNEA